MLNYTITEEIRQEIVYALEWAEWAIDVHAAKGKDMTTEREHVGALWDAMNALQPVDDEYGTGN